MTGETKTGAIRLALAKLWDRLRHQTSDGNRQQRALRFLERDVWPHIPADQLGRRLSRDETDEILGYRPSDT